MKQFLDEQYQWVQESRNIMLELCSHLTTDAFTRSSPNVGNGGSVRNLLVHICNSYHGWLHNFATGRFSPLQQYEKFVSLDLCKEYFKQCDALVASFLKQFEAGYNNPLNGQMHGRPVSTTPLQLFTHVITHEFHHKGQILSLCRTMGYIPVDTDILR